MGLPSDGDRLGGGYHLIAIDWDGVAIGWRSIWMGLPSDSDRLGWGYHWIAIDWEGVAIG